ncbi:Transposon Tf2-6 poly, partial [Brachionus plicatilis]
DKENWDKYLPIVLMSYRNKIHSSTNFTPYELLFGRFMNNFDKIDSNIANEEELTLLRRTAEIKFLLENKLPKTIENLKSSKIKQIKTQNRQKQVTFDTLKLDDEVYIKNEKIQNKFEPSYTGPFFIDRITEYGNYNLKNEKGDRIEESYPRWRLKLAKQEVSTTNSISDDKNEQKDEISEIEKILDHKKIGRGFRY